MTSGRHFFKGRHSPVYFRPGLAYLVDTAWKTNPSYLLLFVGQKTFVEYWSAAEGIPVFKRPHSLVLWGVSNWVSRLLLLLLFLTPSQPGGPHRALHAKTDIPSLFHAKEMVSACAYWYQDEFAWTDKWRLIECDMHISQVTHVLSW